MCSSLRFLVTLVLLLTTSGFASAQTELAEDLRALDAMRIGIDTDLAAVDRQGVALLKQYEQPAEQAQVYYQLAHVHAQSGMKQPKQIIEYAQAALDSKLVTPEQRGTLYSYVSSSRECDTTVKEFAERRRLALAPLLTGLAELQAFGLPDKAPELPVIGGKRGEFDDLPAARRAMEAEVRARREAQRTNELIQRRDTLASQIKWLYAREPVADEELLLAAEKSVGKPLATQLVATAKAERERVERAREERKKQLEAGK
jgi:hypothetical protein